MAATMISFVSFGMWMFLLLAISSASVCHKRAPKTRPTQLPYAATSPDDFLQQSCPERPFRCVLLQLLLRRPTLLGFASRIDFSLWF
jgi:hypothetical protein